MSYRRFLFTLNNYTEDDCQRLLGRVPLLAKYIVFGKEIAPTTETPHLQGYVHLQKKTRMARILADWPAAGHITISRGKQLLASPPYGTTVGRPSGHCVRSIFKKID